MSAGAILAKKRDMEVPALQISRYNAAMSQPYPKGLGEAEAARRLATEGANELRIRSSGQ